MERVKKQSQIGGISIVSFIVVVAISLSYYQFVYVPSINATPDAPEEVLNPPGVTEVSIVEGSALPENGRFYVPMEVRATLEVSNKVVWTNDDTTSHTVTTDNDYEDPINGRFDSLASGGLIPPGGTYEFTFTERGEYPYHCEPHPWMTGIIHVEPNFG